MCAQNGDLEAIVDQLVDELMARLQPLLTLDPAMVEAVDVTRVRMAAGNVAKQLTHALGADDDDETRAGFVEFLWPKNREDNPPMDWWSTPLGEALKA